ASSAEAVSSNRGRRPLSFRGTESGPMGALLRCPTVQPSEPITHRLTDPFRLLVRNRAHVAQGIAKVGNRASLAKQQPISNHINETGLPPVLHSLDELRIRHQG